MGNIRTVATRRSSRSLLIDALESRWLLAYAAADYFPMSTAARWNYSVTQDGITYSDVRSVAATKVNGKAASIVKDSLSRGSTKVALSRTYACSASAGLQILGQVNNSGIGVGTVTFGSPMTFLKSSFAVGNVNKWSNLPVTGTLPIENTKIKVAGTDTGSSKVVGLETVTLTSGQVFLNAVKVVLSHTQKVTGTYQGYTGTLTSVITETGWFVKGVGLVKGTGKVAATLAVPGQSTERTTIVSSMLLSGSNRLPSFARISGGILMVNGTSGNDTMNVAAANGILTATVNGQSLSFGSAAVTDVWMHGLAGNDAITNATSYGMYMYGDDGNDTLAGGTGNDSIDGGAGNDSITGGDGNDLLIGGAGDDILTGGPGVDAITANAGANEIFADDGEIDTLHEVQPGDILHTDADDVQSPDPLTFW